jgi:flagellar biosynthesis/type III secretory pathway M-ring protein FliF/YscJ
MPEHVTFAFFQWFMGGLLAFLLAVVSWILQQIQLIRHEQRADREAQRQDREAQAAAKEKSQESHDNDLSDLWQVLNEHRKESSQHATSAAQFREKTAEQLGDIKATLAAINARLPPLPWPQAQPGDD